MKKSQIDKPKPVKPRKVWAIVDARGIIVHTGLADFANVTKKQTISEFCWYRDSWEQLQKDGYRCVQVVIQELAND